MTEGFVNLTCICLEKLSLEGNTLLKCLNVNPCECKHIVCYGTGRLARIIDKKSMNEPWRKREGVVDLIPPKLLFIKANALKSPLKIVKVKKESNSPYCECIKDET